MASLDLKIRDFSLPDLESILAIQAACGEVAQWNANDYRQLMCEPAGLLLVAEAPAAHPAEKRDQSLPSASEPGSWVVVVGFAAAFRMTGEAELRNLGVDPAYRCQGVGAALLRELHQRLRHSGVESVYLEVRVSNLPAVRFYRNAGYVFDRTRHDYYSNPAEDAILFSLALGR